MKMSDIEVAPLIRAAIDTPFFENNIADVFKKIPESVLVELENIPRARRLGYLNDYIGDTMLLRGVSTTEKNAYIKNVDHSRTPKDSGVVFHNLVNDVAKKKFGSKIRNSVFASVSMSVASEYTSFQNYDSVYLVFPISNYELFYSDKYDDMYVDFLNNNEVLRTSRINVVKNNKYRLREICENHDFNFQELFSDAIITALADDISHNALYLLSDILDNDLVNNAYDTTEAIIVSRVGSYSDKKLVTIASEFSEIVVDSYIEKLKSLSDVYINSIKKTKNVHDIYYGSEVMVVTNSAIMIKTSYILDIIKIVRGI